MECADFEEHFVGCPECQRQLNTTEEFSQTFKRVVTRVLGEKRR